MVLRTTEVLWCWEPPTDVVLMMLLSPYTTGNHVTCACVFDCLQMDGFEDNRGLVVLGATNRPGAIDAALIRPGRFDRIIYMPLPDAAGRAKILQVSWHVQSSQQKAVHSDSVHIHASAECSW